MARICEKTKQLIIAKARLIKMIWRWGKSSLNLKRKNIFCDLYFFKGNTGKRGFRNPECSKPTFFSMYVVNTRSKALGKIPTVHLISWCRNFVVTHSFYDSTEILWKLRLDKFPYLEIRWNCSIYIVSVTAEQQQWVIISHYSNSKD